MGVIHRCAAGLWLPELADHDVLDLARSRAAEQELLNVLDENCAVKTASKPPQQYRASQWR